MAGRYAPRVLLADEVGLGKTIEAGLILHRMLLTGRASRVLILVPEPLLHQWLVEMRRRFNLRLALFDRERLASMGEPNPFQAEQCVLCSLDLLTADPQAARGALAGNWDLLVVDEAHHLAWSPDETSLEYDLVAALAARTPGVLLLTATPEQFGRAGHFGRLRLLDPDRFQDYETFLEEEPHYAQVAALAGRLLDGCTPGRGRPGPAARPRRRHPGADPRAGLRAPGGPPRDRPGPVPQHPRRHPRVSGARTRRLPLASARRPMRS